MKQKMAKFEWIGSIQQNVTLGGLSNHRM